MGFGYLLLGYLVTFVLSLTVTELGFGGLAFLLGYGLMFYGLSGLNRFQKAFSAPRWILIPMFVTALYETAVNLSELFAFSLPFVNATVNTAFDWAVFVLTFLFNFSLLFAIRAIAKDVELPRLETAAIRNVIFVCLYVLLHLIGNLPLSNQETVRGYLALPVVMLQIVWIACNLFLILTCTKDICKAGEEELPPKRYRWEWVNRIGDAYEANRQKSIDRTTEEVEEMLRRRKEKREKKKIKHSKKKG